MVSTTMFCVSDTYLMGNEYTFLDDMGLFRSNLPICPANQHCSQWARNYMKYCLCTRMDWISLILGLVSVLSWVMAEVPQIIMNYKEKSSEGLAMGFLLTWILGDLFNVLGCLLEPATLYFLTTLSLASQSIYYGYFSPGTSKRQIHKIEPVDKKQLVDGVSLEESTVPMLSKFTPSSPIPSVGYNSSPETVYYSSARSLSRSPTHTVNFLHSQRTNTNKGDQDIIQEPLLGGPASRQSPPASKTKNTLCVVFTMVIFLCTYNLKLERNSYPDSDSVKSHNGIVLQVGRKLLQVSGSLVEGSEGIEIQKGKCSGSESVNVHLCSCCKLYLFSKIASVLQRARFKLYGWMMDTNNAYIIELKAIFEALNLVVG
ncbi:hypothetical protein L1987_59861 [Smallanthus sonchifolius]|uniref:Uncharacterized protein n=1 Tax=Smallanthus sonchifolius TaxID=185202 RepID=A0ACB9D776_9ASTR|nr:hypothetical protein L1987_59861 [Smallanthus sonchifolius]